MTREELEKLLAEATPGPWFTFANGHCVGGTPADGSASGVAMCSMAARVATEVKANAALIVAAVNALPELLERVRRLEEALKFYADPNRWPNMPNPKNPHYDLEMDAGSRARFALHARAALNQEPGE